MRPISLRRQLLLFLRRMQRGSSNVWFQPWAASCWTLYWLLFAGVIGTTAGLSSAFFLLALDWVTEHREANPWLIALLPFAGGAIGWVYQRYGQLANQGYNLILDQAHEPTQVLPVRMAPLVLMGTLVTHWFGGSAGREGTAVQISTALADQLTCLLGVRRRDRPFLLIMGISGGFAAVFGTPLAGAIFALEVMVIGRLRYEALLPSLLTALVADGVCQACGVGHTHYPIGVVPLATPVQLGWILPVGMICGIVGWLFAKSTHTVADFFQHWISFAPLRPVLGGLIVAIFVWWTGSTKFIGLGIPTIEQAFVAPSAGTDFLLKLALTAITVGAGFKGGEVTPLFFVGATLGSAMSLVIPLPTSLLAAVAFVAVFAGATHTPMACFVMGLELFGMSAAWYLALGTFTAYTFSGQNGIYQAQRTGTTKPGVR
ncbi:MAG: chloride channel protein [Planctomycetaceae bacterium]|nr:chloride channel protein [Planctomycetaceae bacterium]